jgi:hypothetical protein
MERLQGRDVERNEMKTTIELAREAGGDDWGLFKDFMPEIERLVALVRADEREACLGIAESKRYAPNFQLTSIPPQNGTAVGIAAAIRARGNT